MAKETDFATLVRLLRQRKNQTQEQLARTLDVTVSTLSGWENGHHTPVRAQRKRLLRMADKAGLRIALGKAPSGSVE